MHLTIRNIQQFIILILFCTLTQASQAQSFNYITTENGLSDRRVYSMAQDSLGFLWFLTDRGVDRFDGETFRHYTFPKENALPGVIHPENILQLDKEGRVWQLSKSGVMYRHSYLSDQFDPIDVRPDKQKEDPFTLMYIDNGNRLWTADKSGIYLYDIQTQKHGRITDISASSHHTPTCIMQVDTDTYYIGSNKGVRRIKLQGNKFSTLHHINPDQEVSRLFYHASTGKLIFTTSSGEIYCHTPSPVNETKLIYQQENLIVQDIIQATDNPQTLLLATNVNGIYKLNMEDNHITPYLQANYYQENKLPGDNITALLMDKGHRIWTAVYPIGVIMVSHYFPEFEWKRNQLGNPQSLCNNHVNYIIEDHEGDIWYATTNGISVYSPTTHQWKHILTKEKENNQHSKIFLSLCEVEQGKILAAGFLSGSYLIDKKTWSYTYITPAYFNVNQKADKQIRSIIRDKQGRTWIGGYTYLACINWQARTYRSYEIGKSITVLLQRNQDEYWVGTSDGLFILRTHQNKWELSPVKALSHCYINCLYQKHPNSLYVGTNGHGIFVLQKNTIQNFQKAQTALPSDYIYSMLPDPNGNLICSTESGLTRFVPYGPIFYNWSSEQGLTTLRFNANSGIHTKRNSFIIGSNNGIIELPDTTRLPRRQHIRLYYDRIEVYGLPDSIVQQKTMLHKFVNSDLQLKAEHNGFILNIGCINFDNPNSTLFRWKLQGSRDEWSPLSNTKQIRYLGLSPGDYTLLIQAINKENNAVVQERHISFTILPPWYLTPWMFFIYFLILCITLYMLYHHMRLQHEQQINRSKMTFFLQMAHDIRTPLTLIKAPLEEALQHPEKPQTHHIQTALNNADNLLVLANNLLQMERNQLYTETLKLVQQDLSSYLLSFTSPLSVLAHDKEIDFHVQLPEGNHYVWIDCNKLGSILQNLITNAIKYTPRKGKITLTAWLDEEHWNMTLTDTGYGISSQEKKHIFDLFRTGSAHEEHSSEEGQPQSTGVGLALVKRLTDQHKGEIKMESEVNKGTIFTLRFPIRPEGKVSSTTDIPMIADQPNAPILLIAEDNEDLRNFLVESLRENYRILVANDGSEALKRIEETIPDLILSDVMMEPMSGHDLCLTVKNCMSTSHVPVVLLTALSDDDSVLKGLEVHADLYLTKPFELKILRANLHNILTNREKIYQRMGTALKKEDIQTEDAPLYNGSELDLLFLQTLRETVDKNMKNQNFNVDDLCMAVNMSRSSLFNKIKVLCSISPSEFIRRQRLDTACQLLTQSNKNISEIAYDCGFNDGKYFREVFKKYIGLSPSDYRAQHTRKIQDTQKTS